MRPVAMTSLAVLFLLAWPVPALSGEAPAGAIKVGAEVPLMSDGPGKTRRGEPAVAFGKDVYLAAWQEGWHGDRGNSRIYVARVGLDGKTLDPKGIEVAPCKTGVQEDPRVAFFGGAFLVVWQDLRNGKDCDVLGARVSPQGEVLDARPIAVGAGPRSQVLPDVAADDKGFLVVWHGFQGEEVFPKIFAARVGADGAAGQPVAVTAGAHPLIAWSGKEHLLVYSVARLPNPRLAGQGKCWLRLDTSAKPLSKPGFSWQNPHYAICAMPEGKGWLMATPGGPPNFWGRSVGVQRVVRITPEGKRETAPGDSNYNPTKTAPGNWLDTSWRNKGVWPWGVADLAPAGKHCVVVWERYRVGGATGIALSNGDIRAGRVDGWRRLDEQGGVAVAATAANERNPALAGNGAGKLLCVYEKVAEGRSSIAARTLQTP